MSKHTKEPWSSIDSGNKQLNNLVYYIAAPTDQMNGGFFIAEVSGADKEANARRIVACVNACAGIDIEYLESPDNLATYARKMTIQRDDLLAALKRAEAFISEITTLGGKYHGLHGEVVRDAYDESAAARLTIEKVES